MSDEYRYVLWIRHCKACHNENAFFNEQPLCNKNGINQAYEFGKQITKIDKLIKQKTNLNNYGLYSSTLARAMETAKLISAGIKNEEKNPDIREEILEVPFFLNN